MLRSMTGFGRGEYNGNDIAIRAEIHSVNSRYLDLKPRLPKIFYEYEQELRNIVRNYIVRGRVTATVTILESSAAAQDMRINKAVAKRYTELSRSISEEMEIPDAMNSTTLLNMPDVLVYGEDEKRTAEFWKYACEAIEKALKNHNAMREKEGINMERDMAGRLETVRSIVKGIEKRGPELIRESTERLRAKLNELLENGDFDEQRFAMEAVIYADKLDITEECVRFISHCDQMDQERNKERSSGKKMVFLLQEMHRETNTISSKVNDADVIQKAAEVKEEIERIRELAENIE